MHYLIKFITQQPVMREIITVDGRYRWHRYEQVGVKTIPLPDVSGRIAHLKNYGGPDAIICANIAQRVEGGEIYLHEVNGRLYLASTKSKPDKAFMYQWENYNETAQRHLENAKAVFPELFERIIKV